ncbi:MAG TPA: magnesium transporter CorA family protein [Acidimicrobiia bacterium]|nr:magnesium transporter CorA family protein [Acidimicrobiia bacterium]
MIEILWYAHGSTEPEHRTLDDLATDSIAGSGMVWIECEAPTSDELATVFDVLHINDFAREDLTKAGQRTKLAHYDTHSHVAVYDCALHHDGLRTREIDIVLGTSWFLSVRQAPDDADPGAFPIDHVRRVFELQLARHDDAPVGLLLWAFLDAIVDRYFVVTEQVDDQLDDAEEAVLADERSEGTTKPRPMQLFSLGKSLVQFRRAAIPLRDVVAEIVRREVPYIDDGALVHFQDLADHVLRVGDFVESQRDVLTSLRDAELSLASNRMSLVQQKIAAWGAIFLVATLVTGVLGMNFRDAPGVSWGSGFLAVGGVTLFLCVPMYLYFKRKSWF